jgi:hypothetical protein
MQEMAQARLLLVPLLVQWLWERRPLLSRVASHAA